VAVAAFLAERIGWAAIAEVVAETLAAFDGAEAHEAADVVEADRRARRCAELAVARRERAA